MPDEPGRHISPIGMARDGYTGYVYAGSGLDCIQPGQDIACRANTRILVDGVLMGVAQIVASSIVGFKNNVAISCKALTKKIALEAYVLSGCRGFRPPWIKTTNGYLWEAEYPIG